MDQSIVDKIIQAIIGFLKKKGAESVAQPVEPVKVQAEVISYDINKVSVPYDINSINWADPKAKVGDRFTVKEALLLPSWGVMHVPSEDEKKAIVNIAAKVNDAALYLENKLGHKISIIVHAFVRPEKANCPGSKWDGKDYNRYIYETQVWKNLTEEEKAKKTVPKSPHRTGHAVDFHIVGFEGKEGCLKIRELLKEVLEKLGLRMERMDNGAWIHLDDMPVINARYFNP